MCKLTVFGSNHLAHSMWKQLYESDDDENDELRCECKEMTQEVLKSIVKTKEKEPPQKKRKHPLTNDEQKKVMEIMKKVQSDLDERNEIEAKKTADKMKALADKIMKKVAEEVAKNATHGQQATRMDQTKYENWNCSNELIKTKKNNRMVLYKNYYKRTKDDVASWNKSEYEL